MSEIGNGPTLSREGVTTSQKSEQLLSNFNFHFFEKVISADYICKAVNSIEPDYLELLPVVFAQPTIR